MLGLVYANIKPIDNLARIGCRNRGYPDRNQIFPKSPNLLQIAKSAPNSSPLCKLTQWVSQRYHTLTYS